jgi:tetratricopeptide (TPR) repeat protein
LLKAGWQISDVNGNNQRLSFTARQAASHRDWATVRNCAEAILSADKDDPEGLFLLGLSEKAAQRPRKAVSAFERVLRLDPRRYDAAVELATQYSIARRNGDVLTMLEKYQGHLGNSPRYLDMAATTYTEIGMPEKAWPLYLKAVELQPEISLFQANLAACAVYVGEIERARDAYLELLKKNPTHQRNHYRLARLERAKDHEHIGQMEKVLQETRLSPDRNIFLYYALGKEHEDLGEWDKAFEYYKRGGDAVTSVANYDVESDIAIVDAVIESCDAEWLHHGRLQWTGDKTPIFVVGLPRTGTTLTERIIASHSRVHSVDETPFLQMSIRKESGIASAERMTPEMLRGAASKNIGNIANGYVDALRYRLGDEPFFVDKLPFNVLYLGFIAKAWPEIPIVMLRRNPMDSCFAIYKQVFTWAYKYSYNLDDLARYYIAHERLCNHWRAVLGDQLIEVKYEELVADQENQTRHLLDRLGLEFEEACLHFDRNERATTTASSVQVRQKVHTRSVDNWLNFRQQLQPLHDALTEAGIPVD